MLDSKDQNLLRFSLVFVWLATALTSVWELHGQSLQLLGASAPSPELATVLILTGAGVDAVLGVVLWFWPKRIAFLAALAVMLLMTVVASFVNPAWWLHPLGPLTKNLPIAAILLVLARKSS